MVARSASAKVAMEYGDPEFIPGAAQRRSDHVTVCVLRSVAVREEERMLSLTAVDVTYGIGFKEERIG